MITPSTPTPQPDGSIPESEQSELLASIARSSMSNFEGVSINILIVDDEPKNLTVLEAVLNNPAYRLVRATSAEEALLALLTDEFALLILDVSMPGMTGFELAQMIRQRKKSSDLPIMFLTAFYNEDQHVLEGYGTGAVDYLHKPVDAAMLRSKVAVFAELHRKNLECRLLNRTLLAEVAIRREVEERLFNLNQILDQRIRERTDAMYRSLDRKKAKSQEVMVTPERLTSSSIQANPLTRVREHDDNYPQVTPFKLTEAGAGMPSPQVIPINILIVDDEPKNLTVLEVVLNNPAYRLVRATSADEAFLALLADDFALLILDVSMPGMTGLELARIIRMRKKSSEVPIMFLTAFYCEDQHVLEGYGSGAVDYLHKPVNPVILQSKAAVFAELHRKTLEYRLANRSLLAEVASRRKIEQELYDMNKMLEQLVRDRTELLGQCLFRK